MIIRQVPTTEPDQRGFTILELLIATTIFSMIMLIVTAGTIQFSKQYSRGITNSNTQSTARDIIDDITRAVQFNAGEVVPIDDGAGNIVGYCVGSSKRYSFSLGTQVVRQAPSAGQNQAYHGLVTDQLSACISGTTTALAVTSLPRDLVGSQIEIVKPKMRLAVLDVATTGNITAIKVRVVYGDNDLLCAPTTVPGSCTSNALLADYGLRDLKCKASAGSQFCSVSELSTSVTKRVQ